MNSIVSFRKCTLSNEELIKKADTLCDQIYKEGKIPTRHIPTRPNSDFDLIIRECLVRFKETLEKLAEYEEKEFKNNQQTVAKDGN